MFASKNVNRNTKRIVDAASAHLLAADGAEVRATVGCCHCNGIKNWAKGNAHDAKRPDNAAPDRRCRHNVPTSQRPNVHGQAYNWLSIAGCFSCWHCGCSLLCIMRRQSKAGGLPESRDMRFPQFKCSANYICESAQCCFSHCLRSSANNLWRLLLILSAQRQLQRCVLVCVCDW